MPRPDIDWVTHAPTGLDDLEVDMPDVVDVVDDSVPGALDGHRVRASMLNKTRDKLDYVYEEVGTKPGNEPAGCLRERVASLEGSSATDEKVKASAIDTTTGDIVITSDEYLNLIGGNAVALYSTGSNASVTAPSGNVILSSGDHITLTSANSSSIESTSSMLSLTGKTWLNLIGTTAGISIAIPGYYSRTLMVDRQDFGSGTKNYLYLTD